MEIIACEIKTLAKTQKLLKKPDAANAADLMQRAADLGNELRGKGISRTGPINRRIEFTNDRTMRIQLGPEELGRQLFFDASDLAMEIVTFEAPFELRRRGIETKVVAGDRIRQPDPALLKALRLAHAWTRRMKNGEGLRAIAHATGRNEGYIARLLPLATLSPKIQGAIVDGTQPVDLTLEKLKRLRLPLDWDQQEAMVGMDARPGDRKQLDS